LRTDHGEGKSTIWVSGEEEEGRIKIEGNRSNGKTSWSTIKMCGENYSRAGNPTMHAKRLPGFIEENEHEEKKKDSEKKL